MKKQILFFVVFIGVVVSEITAQIIPPERRGNWTTAGYSATQRYIPRDFQSVTSTGLNGNGATDNSAALQALIDAYVVSGANSIVFYFPAGTYVFNSPITINSINGIVFRGDGSDRTVFKFICFHTDGDLMRINNAQFVGIENLKIIRENPATQSSCNIYFSECTSCWVYGVESCIPMYHHIVISGGSHIVVKGCYLHEADYYGDKGDGLYTHGYGVVVSGETTQCLIEDNVCRFLRHGIAFTGGASHNVAGYNYVFEGHAFQYMGTNVYQDWDILCHGRRNNFNLFEGNVVDLMGADNGGEGGSHDNTFYRNIGYCAEGICPLGLCYDEDNRFNSVPNLNIVGNVITKDNEIVETVNEGCMYIYDVYGIQGSAHKSHYEHTSINLFDWNGGANPFELSYHLDDFSLYYMSDSLAPAKPYQRETPDFWYDNITWPAIGPICSQIPQFPLTHKNPAKIRVENLSKVTVDAPPLVSPRVTLAEGVFTGSGTGGTYKVNGTNVGVNWSSGWPYKHPITIEAVPPESYGLLRWSDGVKINPRLFKPDADITLYAIYERYDTKYLDDWNGSGGQFVDDLIDQDRMGTGGHFPPDRVYVLKRSGLYLWHRTLTMLYGDTLRIRADYNGGSLKPRIFLYPTGDGPTATLPPETMIELDGGNNIVNLKNIIVSGYFELDDSYINTLQLRLINANGPGGKIFIDSCLIKTSGGNHIQTDAATDEIVITNSIFADMGFLAKSSLMDGKAIELKHLPIESCIVENCTFVNWQSNIIHHENALYPLRYLKFSNNTCVNGVSYQGLLSLGRITGGTIIITNNILIDPFSLGNDADNDRQRFFSENEEKDANGYYRFTWVLANKSDVASASFDIRNNYYTISDSGRAFLNAYPSYHDEGSPLSWAINAKLGADSVNAFIRIAITPIDAPQLMTVMNRWYYTPSAQGGAGKTTSTVNFINQTPPDPNWIYDYNRMSAHYYHYNLDLTFFSNIALYGIGDPRWSYYGMLESEFPQTTNIPVGVGWNLVSVPREQIDYTATTIFPGLYGAMTSYTPSSGYQSVENLELGKGYWLYYNSPTTVTIQGVAPGILTIPGKLGWNIIGSRNVTVPLDKIQISGGNSINGGVGFAYISGSGYISVTDVQPGQGVWIYLVGSAAECTITIP